MKIQTILAALALAVLATTGQAVVSVTTSSQTNGTNSLPHTYVPSSSDLINGLSPSAQAGNYIQEGAGGTPVLTDGAFPSPITRDAGGPFQFGAFATGGNAGGTTLTFTLNSPANIRSIDVFGGWQDGGRDQQAYSILYSQAAAPLTFLPLTTVDFNPADPAGHPQVTRVSITDTTGTLAANVTAIRFDFGATENGYSGYSEIDVNPVPEPASAMMMFGGVSVLCMLRRPRF